MRDIKGLLTAKKRKKFAIIVHVFFIFLRLGCTSFGGPIAAIGYFREEFVEKRKWLHEATYADLVALCQLLPGPASSQTAIGIGLLKAGGWGAIASWLGFTLPSALFMILIAFGISHATSTGSENHFWQGGWIQGAKTIAVAVVAHAVWKMGRSLCPDKTRFSFAVIAALLATFLSSPFAQISAILSGGLLGWLFLKEKPALPPMHLCVPITKRTASFYLMLFGLLLIVTPLLAKSSSHHTLSVFDHFFRAGALVFGGAHVVLPLLQSIVVPQGMISNDLFLAGYGIAQAVPGPLLSFSAYLGAISNIPPNGWWGALVCLMAIYLPSFLLLLGLLPFWDKVRQFPKMRPVMQGLNAAVVGLLFSALYNPVWTHSIYNFKDFCFALAAFLLIGILKWPIWLIVLLGLFLGQALL